MAEKNWMRRYILTAGPEGQQGIKIGHINDAIETALHISFSVEKSDSESSNEAKLQIWNLSSESLKILEDKNCKVELRAGYGDVLSLILVGEVNDVVTTMDGADRMTECTVVDGLKSTQSTYTNISISGPVKCKDLYSRIANEMGLSIIFGPDVTFKTMPTGFSFVGKGKAALEKVTTYCGHKYSIQNEVIQIFNTGGSNGNRGYVLSKDTGLLGVPKRIKIGEKDSAQTGWEIEYLLNGAIGVNDIIKIESDTVKGDFKVHKVTIDGDNIAGDWMCTAQVVAM